MGKREDEIGRAQTWFFYVFFFIASVMGIVVCADIVLGLGWGYTLNDLEGLAIVIVGALFVRIISSKIVNSFRDS